jgi:hypothetical protein
MAATNQFAVLVRGERRPSAEQIRRAFRTFNHLTDADAIRLAANAEGILMRHLSSDEARAFDRALEAEGVDSAFVSEANLPELPLATALHKIELATDALVVFDQIGRPERILWGEISMLSLGSLVHVGMAQFTTTTRRMKMNFITGVWPRTTVEVGHKLEKDFQLLLEIVTAGNRKRFQINAAEFPFRLLIDDSQLSLVEKTVWLAGELIRRAPGALLNRGARDVRDGVQLVRGYPTVQVFSDEMVWLLWNQGQKRSRET